MTTQLASLICVLLMRQVIGVSAQAPQSPPMALPGCPSECGNITIPYPFGIGVGCSFDNAFDIDCNVDRKPFIKSTGLEVLSISVQENSMRVDHPVFSTCQSDTTTTFASVDLGETPFYYNYTVNRFTGVGCNNFISMSSHWNEFTDARCGTVCETDYYPISSSSCSGINCCQTLIPAYLKAFNATLSTNNNSRDAGCRYAFLVDQQWIESSKHYIWETIPNMTHVPVVLDWGIGVDFPPGKKIQRIDPGYNISNTQCNTTFTSKQMSLSLGLFRCSCKQGYQGNPYLPEGCQDVDECQSPDHRFCPSSMICENSPGAYICYPSFPRKNQISSGVVWGLFGFVIFTFFVLWGLHRLLRKIKIKKLKEKNFKRNGGLLLQQQLSSSEVNVDKIKIFTSKELAKVTDNFNTVRILGWGGQGCVYKGMLADGKIVAVKKSKLVDERKVKEFINEVVILSQIRHRNVVKLLGCCLETDVPLLVYEFIPNGSLYQYLHSEHEEFPLTWEKRLQIATDVAGALSYLHSSASLPIYHRDIKSSNILLDERYKAKIADFGTSRSIDIDQTHVTTRVQGTFGYLDPEFFQSNHFTEKSDVYSFGVVLVELLTGKKPITSTTLEETQGLASLFVFSMEDNNVLDILDTRVLAHPSKEQIMAVANVAKRCLNLNGKNRPTMKEVVQHLESIRSSQIDNSVSPQDHEELLRDIGTNQTISTREEFLCSTESCPDPI